MESTKNKQRRHPYSPQKIIGEAFQNIENEKEGTIW